MKVKSLAVMALLGMITAKQAKQSFVYQKINALKKHRLSQETPATEVATIKAPKADKKVVQAVPLAKMPLTQAESDEHINVGRAAIWGAEVPYSNQLANGDADDNKELEDEEDPREMIVDDDGFVNQHMIDPQSLK